MKRTSRYLLMAGTGALMASCAPAATGAQGPPMDPPRLAVLLVVDQLPAYLLQRYDDLFSGGLRRLMDHGFSYTQATHDHAVTRTAPGHATLSTGTHPARHGVVSNQWYERGGDGQWVSVLNVVDLDTRIVGAPTLAGSSPRALQRDGLADWLLAAHPEARVVSVSAKDRSAVLLAGRARARVAWFEAELGRFATSTFYEDQDPPWLTAFNETVLPAHAADTVWSSRVPPGWATRSRPDTAAFEGDGVRSYFPHRYEDARGATPELRFWTWWAETPFLDGATLALARAAATAEGLGQDGVPDLLAVSLSQTDRIGHAYGPLSREQLDNLLRLDAMLADFFDWLDATAGPGAWVVAFSSDHGVLEMPEARQAAGRPGLRLTTDSAALLQRLVDDTYRSVGGQLDRLPGPLAQRIADLPWVARAWDRQALAALESPGDSFAVLERRSMYPGRSEGLLARAGVALQLEPFTLTWSYPRGTDHGTPYMYDRHVPLVFMGMGIAAGADDTPVGAVDVAPTLARLLGIPVPGDLDGRPRAPGG